MEKIVSRNAVKVIIWVWSAIEKKFLFIVKFDVYCFLTLKMAHGAVSVGRISRKRLFWGNFGPL